VCVCVCAVVDAGKKKVSCVYQLQVHDTLSSSQFLLPRPRFCISSHPKGGASEKRAGRKREHKENDLANGEKKRLCPLNEASATKHTPCNGSSNRDKQVKERSY
jgi:hypothetical protein